MRKLQPLSILFCLGLASCGPIPGGSLGGQLAEIPAEWSSVIDDGKAFCEIESRPSDPHSIQLECFLHEGSLYAQSHRWALASWWPVESWAAIWIDHPAVRVRIGQSIFELQANQVTEERPRASVLGFRGYAPIPDGVVLFRFERR